MRRLIAIILALTLIIGFTPTSVKAATIEAPDAETKGDMVLYCPKCSRDGKNNMGKFLTEWWEHNYYFSRLWNQFECTSCGFVWNTVIIEVSHLLSKDKQQVCLE